MLRPLWLPAPRRIPAPCPMLRVPHYRKQNAYTHALQSSFDFLYEITYENKKNCFLSSNCTHKRNSVAPMCSAQRLCCWKLHNITIGSTQNAPSLVINHMHWRNDCFSRNLRLQCDSFLQFSDEICAFCRNFRSRWMPMMFNVYIYWLDILMFIVHRAFFCSSSLTTLRK